MTSASPFISMHTKYHNYYFIYIAPDNNYRKDPPQIKQLHLSSYSHEFSHGNPQSSPTQSTPTDPQKDTPSSNDSGGDAQKTTVESTPSLSVPLYTVPDKVRKKVRLWT